MKTIQIKVNGNWQTVENFEVTCLNEETYDIDLEIEDVRLVDYSESEQEKGVFPINCEHCYKEWNQVD